MSRDQVLGEIKRLLRYHLTIGAQENEEIQQTLEPVRGARLTFSEEGHQYALVLSESFLEHYPDRLSADTKAALENLGEYLRCTENRKLLLTNQHAFERWSEAN